MFLSVGKCAGKKQKDKTNDEPAHVIEKFRKVVISY
jgi:hypothetical protein